MPLAQSWRASFPPCVTDSVYNATDTLDPSRGASREATRVWPEASTVRYAVVASRGVWRSLVACFVRDEEVVGSNPACPTNVSIEPFAEAGEGFFFFRRADTTSQGSRALRVLGFGSGGAERTTMPQ